MKKITSISKIKQKYSNKDKIFLEKTTINTNIAGRIISKRKMSNNTFINVQNIKNNIQILINVNIFNKIKYKNIIKNIKIGDIIYVEGKIFKTKTNELTIKANYIKTLVKTQKYFPDKFHKLKNKEIRYKKRYLDLIINKKSRKTFLNRIKIINLIKKYLYKKSFLEVETPMLHSIPGGAKAKPFYTYHNALNKKMYLRIAPELYLKKLIIGGFTKIFELNKNFRNEGISNIHNPEFSMIEIYQAYTTYKDMMKLAENIISYIIHHLCFNKKTIFTQKNIPINFTTPYKKIHLNKAIYKYNKKFFKNIKNVKEIKYLKKLSNNLNIKPQKNTSKLLLKIFDITVQHNLIQPTFITQYPIEVSPLSQQNKKDQQIADRFELFIGGHEIANGFTELNNPQEQKKRFQQQLKNHKISKQKFFYNKEYITALKYGLPPTSGIGIGIDRLVMLLTNNNSIKDVILFPTL